MITKELEATKKCCLYASDFHLEMILVPYIKERLEKTKFVILTENNLQDTIKILLDRINLKAKVKKQIIDIGWDTYNKTKLNIIKNYIQNNENLQIIINGSHKYVRQINGYLTNIINEKKNINIVDCFCVEDNEVNLGSIRDQYKCFLNTCNLNTFL